MNAELLRDLQSQSKDLSRKVSEIQALRVQLESERNGLGAELAETQDALKEVQVQLETKNNTLAQIRIEMERRLREKDDEMDVIRSVCQVFSNVCVQKRT